MIMALIWSELIENSMELYQHLESQESKQSDNSFTTVLVNIC